MSRQWLRSCHLLAGLVGTMVLGTTLLGQEPAAGTQPPETPAANETPAPAESPAPADDQPAPAKSDAPNADAAKKDAGTPDAPKADGEKSDAPKADAEPTQDGAPETPAPQAVSDPAAAQAAFNAKLEEWKTVLKSLRSLTPRYSLATDDEAAAIVEEWKSLIAQGEALIPQLRESGKTAYVAAGGDRATERFLSKMLADDINHDRYEEAYDLGTSMVANGCEVKDVIDNAGVAAFATNHFDAAETLLKRSQDAGGLSPKGEEYLSLIDEYKSYWEEEQALREKEAAADDLPRVKITTNRGEIVVEMLENEAPGTVGNFIHLVEDKKFYDGLIFHRVLPGFMAQGGCPQGNGSGGPGYQIKCETDAPNHRKHFRGTLSMAHAGKDTGGSQFFLTFVPTPHLNGVHTVFGRVIDGMDVLEKIQRIDPSESDSHASPDKIIKMEVLRKRDHEYKPNKS